MSYARIATRMPPYAAFRPRRLLVIAGLCLALAGALPSPAAAAAWMTTTMPPIPAAPDSEAGRLITIAGQHLGAPWKFAAIGPDEFDCSGFVFYIFREAGLLDRIGDKRRGAIAYWSWFASRGLATGANSIATAQPGDILIWGRGQHAGIYIGDDWAISTLINPYGVTIHRVDRIAQPLSAVLHVQISRESPGGPSPSP